MKKFLIPLAALTALGLGAVVPATASARPIASPAIVAFYGDREFRVEFRRHPGEAFRDAGTFRFYDAARREADRLDHRGFETRIVNVW